MDSSIGIDWNDIENQRIRDHHRHNHDTAIAQEPANLFNADTPEEMTHIEVPNTQCPLTPEGLQTMTNHVERLPYFSNNDEGSLIQLWNSAANYLRTFR